MSDLVVGADIGGTMIKWVVTGCEPEPLAQGSVRTVPQEPRLSLQDLRADISAKLAQDPATIAAVGVACAGIISPRTGWLGRSPNLPGWQDMALGQAVSEAFAGIPAVLANDVNAALYGEYSYGAGQGCHSLIMIALGTGVGGGVLLDGRLVTGAADGAGEIGHMVLDPDGPVCACGNRGCLEAYAGSVALLQRARELALDSGGATPAFKSLVQDRGDRLTTAEISQLAHEGDSTASELFARAGRRLGQAVANCVNLLDPERVIIGGGVAAAGDLILEPCRRYVPTAVLSADSRHVPILPADKGSFAAALGAAALARHQEDLA